MAKRKKKAFRLENGRPRRYSLAQLAAMVEALEEEVRKEHALLSLKKKRLGKIRRSFTIINKTLQSEMISEIGGVESAPRRRVAPDGVLKKHFLRVMADGKERGPSEMLELAIRGGYESPATPHSQKTMARQLASSLVREKVFKRIRKGRYEKV